MSAPSAPGDLPLERPERIFHFGPDDVLRHHDCAVDGSNRPRPDRPILSIDFQDIDVI